MDSDTASQDFQKDLLDLASLSDVVVQCGAKTWNLHRAILAQRSQWFRKALLGGFQEAKTKTIRIEEFNEDAVDSIIKHIYGRPADWEKLQGERSFTRLCMDIFNMADYFLLPDLCQSLEGAFGHMVFTKVPAFQARRKRRLDTTELFDIVREVYAEALPAGKAFRPVLATALHSIQYGINNVAFASLIDEVPAVAADVLKFTFTHHPPQGRYPRYCHRCEELGPGQNMGFSTVFMEGGNLKGLCYRCDSGCQKYGPWPSRGGKAHWEEITDTESSSD
ncbi:hypothetical protein F4824DRAFT_504798 [Ustulina deusta]|nr:hypothetical protein F4824DRAFT_504798 [Ustulina deusta]